MAIYYPASASIGNLMVHTSKQQICAETAADSSVHQEGNV